MNIPFLHGISSQLQMRHGGPTFPMTQPPTPVQSMPAPTLYAQAAPLPSPTGIHLHIAPSSLPGGNGK